MKRRTGSASCECGGTKTRRRVSKSIPLAGRVVRVENVFASVCEMCGEVFLDGPTLLKLESKLLKKPATARI